MLGILIGTFFPYSSLLTPYILYILMFVLFLTSLKIDLKKIFERIKNLKLVLYLISLILVISPLLLYYIFKPLVEQEYGLAILILLVMPAGMAVPVYATIFKGDKELALIITTLTSLLCPLTIPILIYLLSGIETDINFFKLFITLSTVIFIPFLSSTIFRKFLKKFIYNTKKYYSSISIIAITFIIIGAIAKVEVTQIISNKGLSIIFPFFLLFVLSTLLFLVGYLAAHKGNKESKITSSLSIAYMNSTLAIVIAAEFFSSETLLLVTLYQIPSTVTLISFGYLIRKYYNSINA